MLLVEAHIQYLHLGLSHLAVCIGTNTDVVQGRRLGHTRQAWIIQPSCLNMRYDRNSCCQQSSHKFKLICARSHLQGIRETTEEHIYRFACDGLRTLCFSYRLIETNEYQAWQASLVEASKARYLMHSMFMSIIS